MERSQFQFYAPEIISKRAVSPDMQHGKTQAAHYPLQGVDASELQLK